MSRFFVPPESVCADKIHLKGKEVHHIVNVMRLRSGDKIVTFDGTGAEYTGIIEKISLSRILIGIEQTTFRLPEESFSVTLAQAIPRKAKMNYIVQKCAELGVWRIIPLQTTRTVVRLKGGQEGSQYKRWERIAREASKQCGRTQLTEIGRLTRFEQAVEGITSYDLALIPCLAEGTRDLKTVLLSYKKDRSSKRAARIIVFIGPEGGFTPEEIKTSQDNGAIAVSLSKNILKSDTAAISSLAIINYELGATCP